MNQPLVSVIVPLFNAEPYIADALTSLFDQGLHAWECIVVNDGSTDGGPAIADTFARRDPRIRVVHQPNRGLSAARNTGISRAVAPWLHFLDADDWMLPGGLRTLVDAIKRAPANLVCAAAEWFSEQRESLGFVFDPGCPALTFEHFIESNRFQVHAALISRTALGSERFDESLPALEDWDLWQRLSARGARWQVAPHTVAAYRLRHASMSRTPSLMLDAADRVLDSIAASLTGIPPARGLAAAERLHQTRARMTIEQLPALIAGGNENIDHAIRSRLERLDLDSARLSEVLGQVLYWRVPFVRCLPPTSWRNEPHLPMLRSDARALLDLLLRSEVITTDSLPAISRALAAHTIDPIDVAKRIAARIPGHQTVILHGLGRNAAALAPLLVSASHRVFGRDDALAPGDTVALGDPNLRVRVLAHHAIPPHSWHIITPVNAPALAAGLPDDEWRIEWNDTLAECAEHLGARLHAQWLPPRPHARAAA